MPNKPEYLIGPSASYNGAYSGQNTAAEPWIQTPQFLHDRARRVHTGLLNLNDEISKLQTSGRLSAASSRYQAWKRLLKVWGDWYGDSSGTTWLWSGTAATLDHYEQEIADWQKWLMRSFPDVAPNLQAPPTQYTPFGKPKAGVPWYVWALGAAAATATAIALVRK